MNPPKLLCAILLLIGTFLGAVSQVLLKKAANKSYSSKIREYLNPLVVGAYAIFFLTTLMSICAYRGLPLSVGPILESTSYMYVTFFGVVFFSEKITRKKTVALLLIVGGIMVYSICG